MFVARPRDVAAWQRAVGGFLSREPLAATAVVTLTATTRRRNDRTPTHLVVQTLALPNEPVPLLQTPTHPAKTPLPHLIQ